MSLSVSLPPVLDKVWELLVFWKKCRWILMHYVAYSVTNLRNYLQNFLVISLQSTVYQAHTKPGILNSGLDIYKRQKVRKFKGRVQVVLAACTCIWILFKVMWNLHKHHVQLLNTFWHFWSRWWISNNFGRYIDVCNWHLQYSSHWVWTWAHSYVYGHKIPCWKQTS